MPPDNRQLTNPSVQAETNRPMALRILTLKLDGVTAGDSLAWCRDPHPTALGFARSSVHLDAGPLGDTVTATLDYVRRAPPPSAAATAAGLRTQVKHELALALTDVGGATFAADLSPKVLEVWRPLMPLCSQRPRPGTRDR